MKPILLAFPLSLLAACTSPHHGTQKQAASAPVPVRAQDNRAVEATFHVIQLKHAEAHELAKVLMNAVRRRSDQTIVADARTNSLIVTCGADEFAPIQKLVAELDIPVKAP